MGVLIGVPADDVVAAVPTFVDVAHVVDEVVVPDVAPTPGDRVVVVNRANGHERILEVWRYRMMDYRVLDFLIFRRPLDWTTRVLALVSVSLVCAPHFAGDDRRFLDARIEGG